MSPDRLLHSGRFKKKSKPVIVTMLIVSRPKTILYLGMCSVHDSARMVHLPSFYSVVTEPYGLAEFGNILNSRNFLQHLQLSWIMSSGLLLLRSNFYKNDLFSDILVLDLGRSSYCLEASSCKEQDYRS